MEATKEVEVDEMGDTISIKQTVGSKIQYILDRSSPHVLKRWIFYCLILFLFMARVVLMNGWFIVAYALGIYLINQLMAFLTPQVIIQLIYSNVTLFKIFKLELLSFIYLHISNYIHSHIYIYYI